LRAGATKPNPKGKFLGHSRAPNSISFNG